VQVLCFQKGPDNKFNVILYYCRCAAKTINKYDYIHASYKVAEMAFLCIIVLIFSTDISCILGGLNLAHA